MVSESRVTWAAPANFGLPMPLDLFSILYATDVRQKHCLVPRLLGEGHNKSMELLGSGGCMCSTVCMRRSFNED